MKSCSRIVAPFDPLLKVWWPEIWIMTVLTTIKLQESLRSMSCKTLSESLNKVFPTDRVLSDGTQHHALFDLTSPVCNNYILNNMWFILEIWTRGNRAEIIRKVLQWRFIHCTEGKYFLFLFPYFLSLLLLSVKNLTFQILYINIVFV